MQIKKTLYILLSLTILLISTSCNSNTVEIISETSIQTESITEPSIEYKTIEPPEDGWTLELLSQVTYLNGKQVPIPFSVNDLGDDYSFKSQLVNEQTRQNIGDLLYNDKYCLELTYLISNGSYYDDDQKFYALLFPSVLLDNNLNIQNILNINGISYGSSIDETLAAMGSYDKKERGSYIYDLSQNDGQLIITFNNSTNTIWSITIWIN